MGSVDSVSDFSSATAGIATGAIVSPMKEKVNDASLHSYLTKRPTWVVGVTVVIFLFGFFCLFGFFFLFRADQYGQLPGEGLSANRSSEKPHVVKQKETCDLYDGKWVWDEEYPIYDSKDCPFMDSGFRCTENGRPDGNYTKWRWQPNHCNLPRSVCFSAKIKIGFFFFLIFFLN